MKALGRIGIQKMSSFDMSLCNYCQTLMQHFLPWFCHLHYQRLQDHCSQCSWQINRVDQCQLLWMHSQMFWARAVNFLNSHLISSAVKLTLYWHYQQDWVPPECHSLLDNKTNVKMISLKGAITKIGLCCVSNLIMLWLVEELQQAPADTCLVPKLLNNIEDS